MPFARGGHATAGTSSGLRGSGNTLGGDSALQSMSATLQLPSSTIGPLMFQASASEASSGVL